MVPDSVCADTYKTHISLVFINYSKSYFNLEDTSSLWHDIGDKIGFILLHLLCH